MSFVKGITGIFTGINFRYFELPMIAPKYHPSNKYLYSNKYMVLECANLKEYRYPPAGL